VDRSERDAAGLQDLGERLESAVGKPT